MPMSAEKIKELLERGLANDSKTEIQVVARFIINKIKSATETADGRKANTIEKKIAKLKELWGKGNTASQIAEIIGGISRNAVIGRIKPL